MRTIEMWFLAAVVAVCGAHAAAADEELPQDAADLIAAYEEDAEGLRREAERKIAEYRRELVAQLKELQDRYTRAAQLDEAVAIRDTIRRLQEVGDVPAEADPGNLTAFQGRVGARLHFRVTGSTSGSVYGTDVYTTDSTLAAAAVHAGVLKEGQTGVVRVTILPGRPTYASTTRHGITTNAWGGYPASYRVEAVRPLDVGDGQPKEKEGKAPAGGAALPLGDATILEE